jgi:inhibitor of KinA sporulation pathway (predicted exonuclease)
VRCATRGMRINPRLSAYLIALTGIAQERLDAEGVCFAHTLAELTALGPTAAFCSNGPDGDVLAENCRLTATPPVRAPTKVIDIRPFLSRMLQRPSAEIDSFHLAKEFRGGCAGRAHDALADARGVAAALRHVLCGNC